MATGTSFKQQCPSCETMVPIRDPSLIGRKIDCPKCKYRFVVEEPADEEPDEESGKGGKKAAPAAGAAAGKGARRGEEGEGGGKKKEGGNSTLLIGVGLAVVALGLL